MAVVEAERGVAPSTRPEIWAHWRYSDEDRRLMAGAALTPTDGASSPATMVITLTALLFVPILLIVTGEDRGMVIAVSGLLGAFGVMLIPALISQRLQVRHLRTLYRAGIREATVKPAGLKVDRHFFPLAESGLVLQEVALQPGVPAILTFTSAYYRISQMGPMTTGDKRIYRLPVPRGGERAAAELVEAFREYLARD